MQYKTIALGLIQEQPELYEKLRSSKRLLPTMDAYAIDLKASHEVWKERLAMAKPGSDPRQIASIAMEMATEELQSRLSCASLAEETEALSLDAAISYIKKASPPA